MPYVNTSVNNLTELRTALFSALTSNGWTQSGNVIHKGNVYIEVLVTSDSLTFRGGTGVDGSDNLTGAAGNICRIGRVSSGVADLSWPMSVEVFIGTLPDEVYLVVNYDVDKYQWAAFGQSNQTDLPGTGCWVSASMSSYQTFSTNYISIVNYGGGNTNYQVHTMGLFWTTGTAVSNLNSFLHHGLDGGGWSDNINLPRASSPISGLIDAQPNEYNGESVLLPISVWLPRSSSKVSLVADLEHARYLRIDNHNPGEIITQGSDQWKVYPFYLKNTDVRDAGTNVNHTGTFGFAFRYDGA